MSTPTALSTLYTDTDSIEGLLSQIGRDSRVDDNYTNNIDAREDNFITWACNWATARVNTFCSNRYEPATLATSWTVWGWATICACWWLCGRRGNPVPDSIIALYEEAMMEMKMVAAGQLNIDDLAMRNALAPVWDNMRMDQRYIVRKMRIIRPLSDLTPTAIPVNPDYLSDQLPESYII